MPTKPAAKECLLARVNFPLYSVEMLSSRHCVVAGGGGQAKTGVANGFEIYEIHHNGSRFVAEETVRYETGSNVVMNCAVTTDGTRSYLVTGQENHCQLYEISTSIVADDKSKAAGDDQTVKNSVRQRKKAEISAAEPTEAGEKVSPGAGDQQQRIAFDITASRSVQTDFTVADPLQRVVRISPNGNRMATGGTDGHIRVWSFPRMNLLHDLPLHSREADDLDFSLDSKRLVSVAKDGLAVITNVETGAEHKRLQWNQPEGCKYMFKRCRFAAHEGKASKSRLFTISNPFGSRGKQKGVLHQWDAEVGRVTHAIETPESLSALAVRDDGRFVAVGTMFTGSVSIYIAFSLQQVLHIPNAHSMFVTGLDFLPISRHGPEITSDAEAAVISISVDNKVCIHSLRARHSIPLWLAVTIIMITLLIVFVLCSLVGI